MTTVAVTGIAGEVAGHLLPALLQDETVDRIVGIDVTRPAIESPKLDFRELDIVTDDLVSALAGVDTVVHLAATYGPGVDDAEAARTNVDGARQVLDSVARAGVGHVVVLSSATVYGAWDNNPVPLTEAAPLRPNPELAYAVHKAEVERLVGEFRLANDASVTVLRPTVALSEDGGTWISSSLRHARLHKPKADDPPAQFLHLKDLAAAIDLARRERLEGAFNVAPDGWLTAETVRELAGELPKPRLPEGVGTWVTRLRWKVGLGKTPPGFIPYANHPWVIANDRLRQRGWTPEYSNEEAFVAGHDPNWYSELSPSKRQNLALGATGLVLAGGVAGIAWAVARRRSGR